MNPTANGASRPHDGLNRVSTPPRVIVLGFYDGPTDGVIQFGDHGPVFRFEMPEQDDQLARHAGSREYHFCPLPPDALDRVTAVISAYVPPTEPVWFPVWRFPTPEIERSVSAAVDAILAEAGPVEWRVTTARYQTFEEFQAERLTVRQTA